VKPVRRIVPLPVWGEAARRAGEGFTKAEAKPPLPFFGLSKFSHQSWKNCKLSVMFKRLFLLISFGLSVVLAPPVKAVDVNCITQDEMALYEAIMAYRVGKGLNKIPLSASLTKVAKLHSQEVLDNGMSNPTHDWKSCPFTDPNCMWKKPSELSNFSGNGYEISWGGTGSAWKPADALSSWKGSSAHNAVIVEKDMWADKRWQSFGVSFLTNGSQTNANGWFAREADPTGPPPICGAGEALSPPQ
jgi:uncharacterized protein YkwD